MWFKNGLEPNNSLGIRDPLILRYPLDVNICLVLQVFMPTCRFFDIMFDGDD